MACERSREALSGVAAGAEAPVEIDRHLAGCAACRAELEALQRALALADGEFARLRGQEPSPDLQARIRVAVAASEASPSRRLAWLWPALTAGAALLIALAVTARVPSTPAPTAVAVTPSPPPALAVPPPTNAAGAESEGAPGRTVSAPPPHAARFRAHSETAELRARPPAPEVLVPSGEAEALMRFAADLRRRSVPAESLLVADLSAPLAEPLGLEIRPLEIVPLDPEEAPGVD